MQSSIPTCHVSQIEVELLPVALKPSTRDMGAKGEKGGKYNLL